MKREIDTSTIQTIWEYFEKLFLRKVENEEEINKFLDTYGSPKLNQ
jgi:hypothetical protein